MAEITVSGARPLPRRPPPRGGPGRVAWVRPRHMLWAPVVAAAVLTGVTVGTPHLRLVYTYSGTDADRFYLRCEYAGLHSQRVLPADGRCPLVQLLKPRRGR